METADFGADTRSLGHIDRHGLHYGVTVRSAIPRGIVTSYDISSLSQDVSFVTPQDIPGEKHIPFLQRRIPILASPNVTYEGEPIFLVAGPNLSDVLRASRLIEIEYETDYSLYSFQKYGDSQIISEKCITYGNPDKAFKNAFQVFEGSYSVPSEHPCSAGVPAAYARVEDSQVAIQVDTQWTQHVRHSVAVALDIPVNQVSVESATPESPERDDRLWYPSLLAVQAALLSLKSGRPVLLRLTKDEDTRFVRRRAPVLLTYKTGLDKDGNISVQDIHCDIDIGAYPVLGDELLDRVCLSALGVYTCDHLSIRGRLIHTNNPPVNALKGLGSPAGFFAAGCHANRLAEISQSDPYLQRRKFAKFPPAHMAVSKKKLRVSQKNETDTPNDTAKVPQSIDKKDDHGVTVPGQTKRISQVLDTAVRVSDFRRKYAAYEMRKKRRRQFDITHHPYRGIGLAMAYQGMGFMDHFMDTQYVSMRLDDKPAATIRVPTLPRSSTTLSVWKNITAGILSIPPADVTITQSNSARLEKSGPLAFGRSISTVTQLIARTASGIQKKRFRSPLPIELTRSSRPVRKNQWDSASFTGMPFSELSWGCAVVEIELDPVTLETVVKGVSCAVACGKTYDADSIQRELETGIYRALQWCRYDHMIINDSTFSEDYGYIPIVDRYPIEVSIHIIDDQGNSATGIDEIPYLVVPAAFVSAVSQASGLYIDRLPLTPGLVHRYLEET